MNYYTYAYLREDRTPYYIGKGKGRRIYIKGKGEVNPPKDKKRIIYLKQNLSEEEAFKHEIYMIAVYGRKDLGTGILQNKTNGGDGTSGYVFSEDAKRKMSSLKKGRPLSDETKRKMSEVRKSMSEETKRKLSEARKKMSEETKRKLSEALKGKKLSLEHRKKISDTIKSMGKELGKKISISKKGKPLTNETKEKMSKAKKGKKGHSHTKETREKFSKMRMGEGNPQYGKKWWNNGSINKCSVECPGYDWKPGRLMGWL